VLSNKGDEQPIIIVKKVKKVAGGHHGGAWKVAYADFVTAMMAFFLLLWLLNVSTDEALEVISSYFDPSHPAVSQTTSGSGGVMGGLSMSKEGAMVTNVQPISAPQPQMAAKKGAENIKELESFVKNNNLDIKKLEEQLREQEKQRFAEAKKALEEKLSSNEQLKELSKNLKIDITEEGLRIQIVDQDGRPMFPSGSDEMYGYTKDLLGLVADVAMEMPNNISVRGHTDSHPFGPGASYTNWELSADRANASRRVLLDKDIQAERVSDVMGKADREPFVEDDPFAAQNRRISIILLNESMSEAFDRGAFGDNGASSSETNNGADNTPAPQPVTPYQKTPGAVYFP
jgi:chemotaxis protein MotB